MTVKAIPEAQAGMTESLNGINYEVVDEDIIRAYKQSIDLMIKKIN